MEIMTLEEGLERAKQDWAISNNLAPLSKRAYESEFKILIETWKCLDDSRVLQERLFKLSPSAAITIYNRWRSLKKYFPKAAQEALDRIEQPKKRRKVMKYLTDHEDAAVLQVAKNDRERIILYLGLKMGLRLSEISNVKAEDFTRNGDDLWLFILRKGGHEQQLRCPHKMLPTLKRFTSNLTMQGRLLLNKDGNPLSIREIQRIVGSIGKRAKLRFPLSPHVLRHTFATQMMGKGADIYMLKNLLGHESVQTTLKYLHFSEEHQEKANRIMDKI